MSGRIPTPPYPVTPAGRVAALFMLHIHFVCSVEGNGDLYNIWEEVDKDKGHTEGLATLDQALLRGITLCWRLFGGRVNFSTSLLLLEFVRNVY